MVAEHVFDKKNAQLLMHQLYCYVIVLRAFCEKHYMDENMEPILMVLKLIFKLSDDLFYELDTWQVVNLDYE